MAVPGRNRLEGGSISTRNQLEGTSARVVKWRYLRLDYKELAAATTREASRHGFVVSTMTSNPLWDRQGVGPTGSGPMSKSLARYPGGYLRYTGVPSHAPHKPEHGPRQQTNTWARDHDHAGTHTHVIMLSCSMAWIGHGHGCSQPGAHILSVPVRVIHYGNNKAMLLG
eukprot:1022324-Rhodomonas_salina.1